MADNPGILILNQYERDTTIIPASVIPPVIVPDVAGMFQPQSTYIDMESGRNREKEYKSFVPQVSGDKPGILIQGFYDLFWKNRIHTIPNSYTLGTLLSSVGIEYVIYNAYEFDAVTVTNQVFNTLDGVTITVGPALPAVIGAKEVFDFSATISSNGAPTINGTIQYTLSNGEVVYITLVGNRSVLFSYEPELPLNEVWKWTTTILQSSSGLEHRHSVAHLPLQSWVMNFKSGSERRNSKMETFIRASAGALIGLPVWLDHTVLTVAASIGDVSLTVASTTDRDFRTEDGQNFGMIFTDEDTTEAFQITAKTSTTLTLGFPLLGAWPVGTRIYPMRLSQIAGSTRQTLYPVNVREMSMQFDISYGKDYGDDDTGRPTYRSLPIYTGNQLIAASSYSRTFDIQPIDTGTPATRIRRRTTREFPKVTSTKHLMIWGTLVEFLAVRSFIHARRGQQKVFWMRSNRYDMEIAADTGAATPNMTIHKIGYTRLFGYSTFVDISVEYVNGTIDYRRIIAASESGSQELLQVDSNFSQTVTAANVAKISYLFKYRLANDSVIFRHDYQWAGEATFDLVEVVEVGV